MKSSRKYFLGGLLMLVLATGGVWLFAQEAPQGPPEPPAPPGEFDDVAIEPDWPDMDQQLGLTEAQREQLRALGREAVKSAIRNRADMALRRMELNELLEADTPDRTLVDKKLREVADLQYGILKARTENRMALAKVFTPEQRGKLRTLMRQRMRARLHRRGPRFGGQGWGRPEFGPGRRGFGMPGFEQRGPGRRSPGGPPPPPPPPNP